jgi:ABC-type amino acid transport substrate-binding protein
MTSAAVAAIALGVTYLPRHTEEYTGTYRIGYEYSPPRQMIDAHGQPYGPTVDLLSEAARRAHVKLQWVPSPMGPDRALLEGVVDIWPILNQVPERMSRFHFTEPYGELTYWLISKGAERALHPSEVGSRLVGLLPGLAARIARPYLPKAQFQTFVDIPAMVAGVCSGAVYAAVIGESISHVSLFHKPEGCELRMSPLPGARLSTGIGAFPKRSEAARVADLLRKQIGVMVYDGTFSTINLKWYGYPTNEAGMVENLMEARRQTQLRGIWLAMVAGAGGLLLWMALRL